MSTQKIYLGILDDHQIVIDGLKLVLQNNPQLIITAEATSAEEMLHLLSQKKVDILLTDLAIPNGMSGYELSLRIKKELPQIKILALSMSEDGILITKMIEQVDV